MSESVVAKAKDIAKQSVTAVKMVMANSRETSGKPPIAPNHKPYVTKGAARKIERSWQKFISTRPVVSTKQYKKTESVSEIEEIVPCLLCGCETFKPVFQPAKKDWEYKVVMCTE